jgi:iron complex transport system substrate-binding protein
MSRHLIALVLVAAAVLAACGPNVPSTALPAASPTPSLADGRGKVFDFTTPPQRIVTLAPSNTELVFAVGAGAQLVGRDELSDYPPEAKQVASIGNTYPTVNNEAVVALKPDLVLAADANSPEQIAALDNLKLNVFVVPNPKTFEGLYANLITLGAITGHAAEAGKLVDGLRARVLAVSNKFPATAPHPKVFYELDATDPTKPYTAGAGTFVDLLIVAAGGQNVAATLPDPYAQISSEELVKQNPEIIILGDSAYGVTVESVAQRPGWADIAAVKNGKVYTFDDNLVSRPGPRLVDGLEALAKLIHPDK